MLGQETTHPFHGGHRRHEQKKQETGRNKKSRDSETDTNGKQRTDTNRKLGNRYERADLIENWLGENLKWWI